MVFWGEETKNNFSGVRKHGGFGQPHRIDHSIPWDKIQKKGEHKNCISNGIPQKFVAWKGSSVAVR